MPLRRTLLTAALAAAVFSTPLRAQEPADWVDPFIGTTNFGTTNPGAVCPNGMMSVVPFNVMGSDENLYDKDARWWSAPYEYRNKFFTGFAHVTLSGVGCPELGSLLVMPTAGALDVDYRNYGSAYTGQTASPGYYSNLLTKYGIRTEVTATPRTSAERYTFPEGTGHILLNLGEGLTNESGAWVRRVSDTEVEGMKLLGTFCYNPQAVFPVYFVMRVSKRPAATKASNYVADFAFLSEAADDSLEGFLFPKTYTFQGTPTADQIIRAMLGQFQVDVLDALDFNAGLASIKARFGVELTAYQLLDLASIVEREGLHAEQRSHVASVFLNRLAGKGDFAGRPYLQSDATLMYVTGGEVTASDIQTIDSPYNSYKNAGLPPTPICSPSAEAISATLDPTASNDLYFFITQDEEFFSETYDDHQKSWDNAVTSSPPIRVLYTFLI